MTTDFGEIERADIRAALPFDALPAMARYRACMPHELRAPSAFPDQRMAGPDPAPSVMLRAVRRALPHC